MKYTILVFIILISLRCYSQTSVEEEWALYFPRLLDYETTSIDKIVKDNLGNLYLVGVGSVATGYKNVITKVIISSWIVEWAVYYDVAEYESERVTDIETDDFGNCYVAGEGRIPENAHTDYITVKFNSLGEQEWVATYDGAKNLDDWINDLFIDDSENVYVTGSGAELSESYWSATTVKYNSEGVMQWKNTYMDSDTYSDNGMGLVVDDSGNVYVACQTFTTSREFLTIKYNSAGVEQWNKISGSATKDENVQFIGIDKAGIITVGGTEQNNGSSGYLIYKYKPDGSYAGGGNTYNSYSSMKAMVVSPEGNVYVTGNPTSLSGQSIDFITVKFNSSGNFQWVKHFNFANDWVTDITIDEYENVFITGISITSSTQSLAVTVKYNNSGDSLWTNFYTHQNFQNNQAQGIILMESGDIVVALHYFTGQTRGNELIKLNNSGIFQWAFNFKSLSQPSSLKKDAEGNIYITGFGGFNQSMWDYITMKCNSAGNIKWIRAYNGPANETDQANDIELDKDGNIYVTGGSEGIGTDFDFTTIKYDSSGKEQWVVRYNGSAFKSDIADHISIDTDGNVYVSGSSLSSNGDYDIITIKYNNLGQLQWIKRYNGPADGNDLSQGLEVDLYGNIYVAGTSDSTGSLSDYVTLKYNPSGDAAWIKRYNGPVNDGDLVSSMALDNSGNVYVTGWSFGNGTQSDYATVKYTTSGSEQWVARWDDPASSYDYANDIAVDEDGNVYVAGIIQGMGTGNDYTTVKYNSTGEEQWAMPYNGQSNGNDIANHIALDYSGEIYVTGSINDNSEYSTLKYNKQGVQQWKITHSLNGYKSTPTDLLVDNSGNVVVAGYNSKAGEEWIWSIINYKQEGFIPTIVRNNTASATDYILSQNFPNPFSSNTTISYSIPVSDHIILAVYDLVGKNVRVLVNEYQRTGEHNLNFDSGDLPDGIYFYRLKVGIDFAETKKMMVYH